MIPQTSKDNPKIVFFEHNPYMSVELLDLLNDYKIICYNDDATYRYLKEHWDVESYLNTNFIEEPESDQVAEILLGNEDFLRRVIEDRERSKILFFYMNRRMEELRVQTGIPMLLPPFDIQERLGNKIFFSEICDKLDITKNKSLSFGEESEDMVQLFKTCKEVLGAPFIIQDALGESGWDTSLVSSENELQEARKKIKNALKASRYIPDNIPVSVHVCILETETIIHGPWLQLIGLPELSTSPFRFTGNDTNQFLFSKRFIDEVLMMSQRISQFMKEEGYRGIFGIDYLWDKNTNVIYPQEINSRFVGLTRLLTGIQKDQSLFPDLLKHIEIFDTPSYTQRAESLRVGSIDLSSHSYSQVIVRNIEKINIKILTRLEPGIYKIQENLLRKTKQSLFVRDMANDEILITSAAHTGCELSPGEVIVRLILKKSVIDDLDYKLREDAVQLINMIRKQVISEID